MLTGIHLQSEKYHFVIQQETDTKKKGNIYSKFK